MSIEVLNESGIAVDETGLVELARHVLDDMKVHPLAELSLLLVDESAMSELHEKWMGEPGPTDVLAFPMDELRPGQPSDDEGGAASPGLLGDVVLCPAVADRQAGRIRGTGRVHTMRDELDVLCTHGILHLLGYDHAEPAEMKEMFGLQDRLLAAWREKRSAS